MIIHVPGRDDVQIEIEFEDSIEAKAKRLTLLGLSFADRIISRRDDRDESQAVIVEFGRNDQ